MIYDFKNLAPSEAEKTIGYVESQLQKPVSKKAYKCLYLKLENAQKTCENTALNDKIVILYGKILDEYNKHIKSEVREITALAQSSQSNIPFLQKKIRNLKNTSGISMENAEILSQIENTIKKSSKPLSLTPVKIEGILIEEIEALFELASFIYYGEEDKATEAQKKLSPGSEKRVFQHLSLLKTNHSKDNLSKIQALFATAHELAGKSLSKYPLAKELDIFFKERKKIMKKDSHQNHHIGPFLHRA